MNKSIPFVSLKRAPATYHAFMPKKLPRRAPWAARLMDHLIANGESVANIAKKMVRQSTGVTYTPGAIHHWLNGQRQINLAEFLELCRIARADPAFILFGRRLMREDVTDQIQRLVETFGSAEPADRDAYTKTARPLKIPAKAPPAKPHKP